MARFKIVQNLVYPARVGARAPIHFPDSAFLASATVIIKSHGIDRRNPESVPLVEPFCILGNRIHEDGPDTTDLGSLQGAHDGVAQQARTPDSGPASPGPLPAGRGSSPAQGPAYSAGHGPAPASVPHRRLPARNSPQPASRRIQRMSATPRFLHSPGRAFLTSHPDPARRNQTPTRHAPPSGVPVRVCPARPPVIRSQAAFVATAAADGYSLPVACPERR